MSDGWTSDYYQLPEDAEEIQDLIEHRGMNFAQGNIFKAIYRLGEKDGTTLRYDLNKIIWYAERELKRLERAKWVPENDPKPITTSTTEPRRQRSSEPPVIRPGETLKSEGR